MESVPQRMKNNLQHSHHHHHRPNNKKLNFKRRTRRKGEGGKGAQQPFRLLPRHQLPQPQQQQHLQQVIRYDAVAEAFEEGAYGVVHQMPCIPDHRRMIIMGDHDDHKNKIHNLTYFLEARVHPNEEDRPLYIYNPMILPLNDTILEYDTILKDLGFDEGVKASYIAVYRVSNFGNCHGTGHGVPETYRNYLGIALLDLDLNILHRNINTDDEYQYLDIVIDLNRHLSDIGWSPKTPEGRGQHQHHHHIRVEEEEPIKQYMQDCQLIAVPSSSITTVSTKADSLVLICNNYAMEVRLERTPSSLAPNNKTEAVVSFTNTYGSGLQLTALTLPRTIVKGGKNLHYFRVTNDEEVESAGILDGEGNAVEGYLEIWPGGPHETMRIEFTDQDKNNRNYERVLIKSNQPEPDASFLTVDGIDPKHPLIARDSGSACCISVQWQAENDDDYYDIEGAGERRLLLGFSHRKTRRGLGTTSPPYNYVSRVYAFEPTPPFNLVARSGYFCLGFALNRQQHQKQKSRSNDEVNQSDNEQVWGAANEYKLTINGIVFENCPAIHFVTGIADKLGDEEHTAIISYGVNDCYPRMVEVSKQFLVSLLRPLSSM